MGKSLFLAKVLGLYLIITDFYVLINYQHLDQILLPLFREKGALLLIAIITLITGILLIVSHNIWEKSWRVLITLLAWLTFIIGIMRLFLLDYLAQIGPWMLQHKIYLLLFSIIFFLLGLFLTFKGFYGKN